MLIELAIGDTYGGTFEFANRDFVIANNNASGYVDRGDPLHVGRYTDDTQMSLAIAELLVAEEEFSPQNIADKFVEVYRRDPRPGYARRFKTFIESVKDGSEFLERIHPTSSRCGAAMRAMPLGIIRDPQEVCEKAVVQARLTHNTATGRRSAMASAMMTHYFLYDVGPKKELTSWLESNVPGKWSPAHHGKVSMHGMEVVRAALTAVMASNSMTGLLRSCVAFTGDVDSVAAIALAAGAGSREIEQDLPAALLRDLEDGPYGRTYLEELDDRLLSMA